VLVSGYPRNHLTGRGLDELDAELVAKPFREGELVRAVVEAMAQAEGGQSHHAG